MNLKGDTGRITGGGHGIGRGLSEMFNAEGSEVIIAGRNRARLSEVRRDCESIDTMALDVSDDQSTLRFAVEVIKRRPELNVVIHSYTQSLRYQLKDTPVGVFQLIPPFVQTELSGPQQASDPSAMPLPAPIGEVTDILRAQPTPDEICVERVLIEREAEASGNYETVFREFSDPVAGLLRDRVPAKEGG